MLLARAWSVWSSWSLFAALFCVIATLGAPSSSDGSGDTRIFKSSQFFEQNHGSAERFYPYCINRTHSYPSDDEFEFEWQFTMNQMKSLAWCSVVGAVGSQAVVVATNILLSVSGFVSSGVAGGTLAAFVQGSIGDVAAGSLFAYVQSFAAMGGVTFGTMSVASFAALLVICGSDLFADMNFMNPNATQCLPEEKVLYLSLEWADEIMDWFYNYEYKNNEQSQREQESEHDAEHDEEDSKANTVNPFVILYCNPAGVCAESRARLLASEVSETVKHASQRASEYVSDNMHSFSEKYRPKQKIEESFSWIKEQSQGVMDAAQGFDAPKTFKSSQKTIKKRSRRVRKQIKNASKKATEFVSDNLHSFSNKYKPKEKITEGFSWLTKQSKKLKNIFN